MKPIEILNQLHGNFGFLYYHESHKKFQEGSGTRFAERGRSADVAASLCAVDFDVRRGIPSFLSNLIKRKYLYFRIAMSCNIKHVKKNLLAFKQVDALIEFINDEHVQPD